MLTRLAIPEFIHTAILAHARTDSPIECCGLLAGRIDGETGVVSMQFSLRNDLASPTEYLTNPRDLFAALKAVRNQRLDVLAFYHSHPTSEPIPSRTDLERNYWGDNALHVIVGLGGAAPSLRAWRLRAATFEPVELELSTHLNLVEWHDCEV